MTLGTNCFPGRSEGQRAADPIRAHLPKAKMAISLNHRIFSRGVGGGAHEAMPFRTTMFILFHLSVVKNPFTDREELSSDEISSVTSQRSTLLHGIPAEGRCSIAVPLPQPHPKKHRNGSQRNSFLRVGFRGSLKGLCRYAAASRLLLGGFQER